MQRNMFLEFQRQIQRLQEVERQGEMATWIGRGGDRQRHKDKREERHKNRDTERERER